MAWISNGFRVIWSSFRRALSYEYWALVRSDNSRKSNSSSYAVKTIVNLLSPRKSRVLVYLRSVSFFQIALYLFHAFARIRISAATGATSVAIGLAATTPRGHKNRSPRMRTSFSVRLPSVITLRAAVASLFRTARSMFLGPAFSKT